VRDLDAPAGQLLAVRQRRPDEVFDPGGAGGLHGRRADLGLTRHLRGIPEIGHDEGSVRPLQRGTEGARVEQIGLDHLDSTRCQRPRSVAGRIAAGNTYRELARAQERVHDATTLQTRTTEYRYDLLGHHRLLVPDASRCARARRPSPALLSDPKAIWLSRTYSGAGAVPREAKDYLIRSISRMLPQSAERARSSKQIKRGPKTNKYRDCSR